MLLAQSTAYAPVNTGLPLKAEAASIVEGFKSAAAVVVGAVKGEL